MNKEQTLAAIVAAVAIVGGGVAYKLDDGSIYEVPADAVDCTYQPPGLRAVPCLVDGGFDVKKSDYLDAGCLAQVCPRYAEIVASGKSQFFAKPTDVKTKGVITKQPDAVPVDATPVAEEAAPVEVKP